MKKQPQMTDATRSAMLDAFWAVYQQKPMARITIKDISDAAHVHRSTFYRYFTDIYDVLHQFEQRILDEISATLEQVQGEPEVTNLLAHAGVMVGALKDYAPAIYHLTSPTGDPGFRDQLRQQMLHHFSGLSFVAGHSLELDYLFNFVFTNILANLNFWYEHRQEYSLEQIAELSKTLISKGITDYVQNLKC